MDETLLNNLKYEAYTIANHSTSVKNGVGVYRIPLSISSYDITCYDKNEIFKSAVSVDDLYLILKARILKGEIFSIYCSETGMSSNFDYDWGIEWPKKYSDNDIMKYDTKSEIDECCNLISIDVYNIDGSEKRYHIRDGKFELSELLDNNVDGIKVSDFIISEKHIFVAKHIVNITTHSIGSSTFITVWSKNPVLNDKGTVIEEGVSIAFMLKDYHSEIFKKSIESAGRYDLLLNL